MVRWIFIVFFTATVVEGCVFAPAYNGTVNVTRGGFTCQRWDSQTPHAHSKTEVAHFPNDGTASNAQNYCRDPNGSYDLWCYTTDRLIRWDKCNISTCARPDVSNAKCDVLPLRMTSRNCSEGTDYYNCIKIGVMPILINMLYHFECDRYFCCRVIPSNTKNDVSTERINEKSTNAVISSRVYYSTTMKSTQLNWNGSATIRSSGRSYEVAYFLFIFKVIYTSH